MDFFKKMETPKADNVTSAKPTGDAEHVKCLIIGSGPTVVKTCKFPSTDPALAVNHFF